MANEISVSATVRYAKNKAAASLTTSFLASQTGDKYEAGIQTIGATEETVQKNDVGTVGFAAFRNSDDTNFVQLGAATGAYTVKLLPGEGCLVRWNGSTVYAKADTAPIALEYLLIEA
jgi:hypothetical protein